MPPSRPHRPRVRDVVLLGFGVACAIVVVATEGPPRLAPPVVSYGSAAASVDGHGVIDPGCLGIAGLLRCR